MSCELLQNLSNPSLASSCYSRMWSLYDHIFSTIFYTSGGIGISANVYLIILIFTKSPKSLHLYRVFLANAAFSDLLFSTSSIISQIRLIPYRWAFAYVSLGPAALFGPQGVYLSYSVLLHSIFYTFLCFPLSFGFRYYVLIRPPPEIRSCVIICLSLWLIAFSQEILFVFSESPPDQIREYLAKNKPYYNLTDFVIAGNNMQTQPLTCVTLATICLPMFPIYVIVIYFYKGVQKYLTENNRNLREGTIKGHRRLLQALTIHASLPLLFIFPPITIYMLYHLEIINFTIIEYLVYTLFSLFPACSPMITIYFVKPYNMATRELLGLRVPQITSQIGGMVTTFENTVIGKSRLSSQGTLFAVRENDRST